jgi:hypothetical protein
VQSVNRCDSGHLVREFERGCARRRAAGSATTPGTINTAIPEQQYHAQCHTKGWTRLYRPPVRFTNSLKKLQMKEYGYPLARIRDYEEDRSGPGI